MHRRNIVIVLSLAVSACGGSSSGSGPTAPTPAPASHTYTVSGIVRESDPTSSTTLGGVRIEVIDGTHAGQGATTGSDGKYSISGLSGGLSLRATKDAYESESKGVTVTQARTVDWSLRPTPRQLTEALTRVFRNATGAPGCVFAYSRPCFEETWPIHNPGTVEIRAVWQDYRPNVMFQLIYSDWISIDLLKDGNEVAHAQTTAEFPSTTGTTAYISQPVEGGSVYKLRINYFYYMFSRNDVTVQVSVNRPN